MHMHTHTHSCTHISTGLQHMFIHMHADPYIDSQTQNVNLTHSYTHSYTHTDTCKHVHIQSYPTHPQPKHSLLHCFSSATSAPPHSANNFRYFKCLAIVFQRWETNLVVKMNACKCNTAHTYARTTHLHTQNMHISTETSTKRNNLYHLWACDYHNCSAHSTPTYRSHTQAHKGTHASPC